MFLYMQLCENESLFSSKTMCTSTKINEFTSYNGFILIFFIVVFCGSRSYLRCLFFPFVFFHVLSLRCKLNISAVKHVKQWNHSKLLLMQFVIVYGYCLPFFLVHSFIQWVFRCTAGCAYFFSPFTCYEMLLPIGLFNCAYCCVYSAWYAELRICVGFRLFINCLLPPVWVLW